MSNKNSPIGWVKRTNSVAFTRMPSKLFDFANSTALATLRHLLSVDRAVLDGSSCPVCGATPPWVAKKTPSVGGLGEKTKQKKPHTRLTIWLFPVQCGAYRRRVSHECKTASGMWRGSKRRRCLINGFEDCFNIRVDVCAASHTELVPAGTLWIGNVEHHTNFRWKELKSLPYYMRLPKDSKTYLQEMLECKHGCS